MFPKWQFSVSESLDKGSRGYMEDFICNHVEKVNGKILFGIFGVFDGHGGSYASSFVKQTIVEELKQNVKFWSNDKDIVLIAIKEVYSRIQNLMWIEREKWPQSIAGYKSTAGTTATIAIIRNDLIYVGHVGDSAIVLANRHHSCLKSEVVTKEHKPTDCVEKHRIEKSGGTLKRKTGIVRIVWSRKKLSPSSDIEQVPFLAVARSLGDLWSYDQKTNCYHVSPEPDLQIIQLNAERHRALILASDGVWNVIDSDKSVDLLNVCNNVNKSINPAELIVKYSLYQWQKKRLRPDNISVVVVKLNPEGCTDDVNNAECSDITELHEEIRENNMLDNFDEASIVETLEYVHDFEKYAPNNARTGTSSSEETELLKSFVLSSDTLSRHCIAWRDDLLYWEKLKFSFGQIGLTRLPNIVSYFDSAAASFESLLISFSWAVTCLKCIFESTLSQTDKERIRLRPLLSEFWTSFYHKIISPNLCFTADQLTQTSVYSMIMNHIFTHKHADIKRFIDDLLGPTLLLYSLKKCQSYTIPRPTTELKQNLYVRPQLKRASSLELSTMTLSDDVVEPALSTVFNSNSSTPPMSPNAFDSSMESPTKIFQRPLLIRRPSNVISLVNKTNISTNICRLSSGFLKRGNTLSERKLVRYVARKKRKSH